MAKIYITGHRNPDLDSVCSAYAYARLKSTLDTENEYIAIRCGHLSDSCENILNALEISVPPFKMDVFPKVKDVMLRAKEHYDVNEPLSKYAANYLDSNPSVTPVYDGDKYAGLLSVDDVTAWYMKKLTSAQAESEYVPKIGELMRSQETPVESEELFEEAKVLLSTSEKRGLSVVDAYGNFLGFVTRRCFLKAPRYNVILVDHNEPHQSIKGIETANIVEIIDHHRLDALKTALPIFIDAEPLGSTCTIVYQLYLRNGLTPDRETAKVLLTGMMADTLVLKSPTTTEVDRQSAKALAEIIGVDVTEFGLKMFSYVERLSNIEPERAILSDFKRYTEKGINIGIGQCEATTLDDIDEYKDAFRAALENIRARNGLDWAVIMITNVLKENSVLITTDYRAAKHLPYSAIEQGIYDMPGVMSRKKQLLPEMIYTLGM